MLHPQPRPSRSRARSRRSTTLFLIDPTDELEEDPLASYSPPSSDPPPSRPLPSPPHADVGDPPRPSSTSPTRRRLSRSFLRSFHDLRRQSSSSLNDLLRQKSSLSRSLSPPKPCDRCGIADAVNTYIEMAVVNRLGMLLALGNMLFDQQTATKLQLIPRGVFRARPGVSPEYIRAMANASWSSVEQYTLIVEGYLLEARAYVNDKIEERMKRAICTLVDHVEFDEAWETYSEYCQHWSEEELDRLQRHPMFPAEALELFKQHFEEMPPGPVRECVLQSFAYQ